MRSDWLRPVLTALMAQNDYCSLLCHTLCHIIQLKSYCSLLVPLSDPIIQMAEEKQNQNGMIEWKVNDDLLQQFKEAKPKQQFKSPQFKTSAGTSWRIQFYPCGDESPDYCSIFLECVKLNGKKRIGVNWSWDVMEVGWSDDHADTFKNDGESAWGKSNAFKREKLNKLNAMTVRCFVEETMAFSDGNTYFEWNVNHNLIKKWKNAEHKAVFYSPTFDGLYMGVYPNGLYTKGTAYLAIYSKPTGKDNRKICYCIEIDHDDEALNHCQIQFDGKPINNASITCKSPFKFKDLKNTSEITICVKIWDAASMILRDLKVKTKQDRAVRELRVRMHVKKQLLKTCSAKIVKLQNESSETIENLKRQNTALKREIMDLQNEAQHFKTENTKLKQEKGTIKAKLDECAMTDIKPFDAAQEVVIEKDTIEKQKELDSKLSMDEHRLHEWALDSIKIQNELKNETKEQENVNETMTELLNRYIECKELCDEQQTRMENVITHWANLNKMKKALKTECVQSDEKTNKMDKEHQDLRAKHETLKTERIKIQTQWMNALKDMNRTIQEENETNALKSHALHQFNVSSLEATQWEALRNKCAELMRKYQQFDSENEQNIQQMTQMFDALWNKSLKQWFEWSPKDIICWIKYLKIQKQLTLSNEFNFDSVLKEMI
eukprot:717651_1